MSLAELTESCAEDFRGVPLSLSLRLPDKEVTLLLVHTLDASQEKKTRGHDLCIIRTMSSKVGTQEEEWRLELST